MIILSRIATPLDITNIQKAPDGKKVNFVFNFSKLTFPGPPLSKVLGPQVLRSQVLLGPPLSNYRLTVQCTSVFELVTYKKMKYS